MAAGYFDKKSEGAAWKQLGKKERKAIGLTTRYPCKKHAKSALCHLVFVLKVQF